MIQRKIIFFGDVQGVGFRFTARTIAKDYSVTGTVRNLPNGCVELLVEGQSKEIDRFLASLRVHFSGYIDREEATESPASGAFSGFGVSA